MNNQKEKRTARFHAPWVVLLSMAVALIGSSAHIALANSGAHATGVEQFDQQMGPILESYLRIGNALSTDSLDGVRRNADAIAKRAATLDSGSVSGEHATHYKNVPTNLEKAAQALSKAETLNAARESFKQLSMPIAMWATMSKPKNINVLYCSEKTASWVQKQGSVRNPYYGPKMLGCGEVVGGESDEAHNH